MTSSAPSAARPRMPSARWLRRSRSDTLALCYHALSPTWTADLSVTPAAFDQALRALAKAGYRGVTFSEAAETRSDGKRVAVTFDDAFTSVVTYAKPVLDDFGWPATVYAVTEFAATGRPLHWEGVSQWADTPDAPELASLDWEQLNALADQGWEIGSHTASHPHLTRTTNAELQEQLTASRAAVEDALGRPCPSIAYPYGDVDERVISAARAAGYTTGAALPARWPARFSTLEVPRVGVYHPDDERRFRLKRSRIVRAVRARTGR